jgi:alanine-alpha-ketoisovalerate/valine-pyruvate aminotransferase
MILKAYLEVNYTPQRALMYLHYLSEGAIIVGPSLFFFALDQCREWCLQIKCMHLSYQSSTYILVLVCCKCLTG